MFGYGLDKRTIYFILGIIIVLAIMNTTTAEIVSLLLTLPAVIIAITFHEFAHAWMADRLGDTTPRNQGRLTLNPLSHLDPFGFVLLMFAHVGWGKPVQINPNNFTSNKSRGTCEMLVSLAGPIMNFILAFVFLTIYGFISFLASDAFFYSKAGAIIVLLLQVIVTVNIGLGVFNLIPLPPLDGEKIFRNLLPYRAQAWLDRNSQALTFAFMLLWITGLLGTVVSPVINIIYSGMSWAVIKILGLFL